MVDAFSALSTFGRLTVTTARSSMRSTTRFSNVIAGHLVKALPDRKNYTPRPDNPDAKERTDRVGN